MADSLQMIENTDLHSDEPLDPRIHIELERANAATIEINNLETQLDNAQKSFQITFTNSKQRLATLAKKLGRCVERARPYYNACKQAEEAQLQTQKAAQEYQNSVELYHIAQKKLLDAESNSLKITREEYLTHITQAEQDKIHCEEIHEEKSKLYQEYEQQRITLSRSLTRTIEKSKSYFQEKTRAEKELKKQKYRIEDVQKAIMQAKQTYRTALNNLEQISEEIHSKRQNQIPIKLPPREPGVGAENPDEFLEFPNLELTEFPKIDLSDDSSDAECSNTSTNCLHPSSNSLLPLTTNKLANRFSTQCVHDQSRLSDKTSKRWLRNNEIPLLSHLFGAHKFHSDSNLNLRTKN